MMLILVVLHTTSHHLYSQTSDSLNFFKPKSPSMEGDSLNEAIANSASKDTTKSKKWPPHKRAMALAVVCPGAGQIYNKKFWKLPILYAGTGAIMYFWITNQTGFREFKSMYNDTYDKMKADPTYTPFYFSERTQSYYTSINQLSTERDTYRRYRDFAIAGAIALYAISIMDAYIDAHLKNFDLSPDLSLSIKPLFYAYNNTNFTGISLGLKFKDNRKYNNQLIKSSFNK